MELETSADRGTFFPFGFKNRKILSREPRTSSSLTKPHLHSLDPDFFHQGRWEREINGMFFKKKPSPAMLKKEKHKCWIPDSDWHQHVVVLLRVTSQPCTKSQGNQFSSFCMFPFANKHKRRREHNLLGGSSGKTWLLNARIWVKWIWKRDELMGGAALLPEVFIH